MNREEAANILDLKTRPEALADFVGPELAGIVHQAMIMGAEALRSPQPDPITGLVPCDFCTDTFDQKPLLQENKYKPYTCMMSTISIEENNGKHQIEIDLWDGGNIYAAFEINYCPMCGRKLTAPPRPGAIGPGTGEMDPNGDEGDES